MQMPQQSKRLAEHAPFNWPRKRKLRWGIVIGLALLVYPVLVTLALWTGFVEWMVRSEDLRVEISEPGVHHLAGQGVHEERRDEASRTRTGTVMALAAQPGKRI
jgi:hypothetical protein